MPAEICVGLQENDRQSLFILPFSNPAGIVQTHFAGIILCHFRHEANICNASVVLVALF